VKKNWYMLAGSILMAVALVAVGCGKGAAPAAPAVEIKVGALQDMTGATSDVGKDEALGVVEATTYFNDQGGVNGKRIKLFQYDYGYRVPEAVTTYKRFRDFDKVVSVLGWGTGDTEALSPTVTKDKIVYLSSSFSGALCDPAKTPYNFVYSSDYSTKARATLQYWYDNYWMKDPRYKADREAGRKPRFVFFGMFASPYATAPVAAIKEQAKALGFEILNDQDVSLFALDTKSQVLAVKETPPDFVWHGNTTMSVATALKDFYSMGLTGPGKKTMHGVNCWGVDENLIKLAGPACEEVVTAAVCAYFGWDYPMKNTVVQYCQKLNPGTPLDSRLIRTVQGWVKVGLMVEALKDMDNAGELNLAPEALATTREGLKKYLEADFSSFTSQLGLPEYVCTDKDHRPSGKIVIAQIQGGKIVDRGVLDMKAKFASEWPKWLGY